MIHKEKADRAHGVFVDEMPKKKSSAKSASKPKKQQDNKAKTTKDALDAFWAQKEAEKKTEKVVRSMRARVASKNGGPFFYLGGKRTLRSHEELAALSYNKGWHPNESVRDKRLGYGRYIRMWTLLPINSFWSDGIRAQSPSVLKLEYLDETIWQETPADSQRQLSKFGGGCNPVLGRVLYEAIVRNDDFGELLDQFLDQQDGKRKVIIVKAPFVLSSAYAGTPQLTRYLIARSPDSCTKVTKSSRSTQPRSTPVPSTTAVSTMKPARSESVGSTMNSRKTQCGGTHQKRKNRPVSMRGGWTGRPSSQSRAIFSRLDTSRVT